MHINIDEHLIGNNIVLPITWFMPHIFEYFEAMCI